MGEIKSFRLSLYVPCHLMLATVCKVFIKGASGKKVSLAITQMVLFNYSFSRIKNELVERKFRSDQIRVADYNFF